MMRKALLLLLICAFTLSFAQYYDIAMVRADNGSMQNLVYDDNSTSYKDNSIENPDVDVRICASDSADLLGKYVVLAYADGFDGDYIVLTHFPVQITSVPPSLCVYETLEISSFRAWYPSIPYVFISDSPTDFSAASRWKLSRLRGWFIGDYGVVENRTGAVTSINVTNATEDTGALIVPDVDYLVIGLVREDYTTMDTGISSPENPINLTADSTTATYQIFINGIGPDLPPYVEIITPEPITYDTGTIPFTYIMYDDDDIVACWYILDGTTVNMPECGPAYILNVGQGTHNLELYGEDTTGNIGSDSVTFQVGAPAPPTPPSGGGSGTPYYPHVPPPPFEEAVLSINPENIYVTIDYPYEGIEDFALTANIDMYNVSCFVKGDFEQYTTVEVHETIPANGTIIGTVTVDMPPTTIIAYDNDTKGYMQCVGAASPTLIASTIANVYLIINRPDFESEDEFIEVMVGEEKEGVIPFFFVGEGNSSAVNISIEFTGAYSPLISEYNYPTALGPEEMGLIDFSVMIPDDVGPGLYDVPFTIYENGVPFAYGILTIDARQLPPYVCTFTDILWTLLILLIGFMIAVYLFRRKLDENMKKMTLQERKDKWKLYRKPIVYAVLTMLIAVIIWLVVVSTFLKCI